MSAAERIKTFLTGTDTKKEPLVNKIRIEGKEYTPEMLKEKNYHEGKKIKIDLEPKARTETKKEPTEKEKLFEYIKSIPDESLNKLATYVDYLIINRAPIAKIHEEKIETTELETLAGEDIQEAEIIEEEPDEEKIKQLQKDPVVKTFIEKLETIEEKSPDNFREFLEGLLNTIEMKRDFGTLEELNK